MTTDRTLLHTRDIRCQGFKREDSLWDIEASLSDIKTYSFSNLDRGEIKAGEPIHLMQICLTLDIDLNIHAVRTNMDFTPYDYCKKADKNIQQLVGLKIGPGWLRLVRQRIGGTKGCTHLFELLGPLATTAYQTTFEEKLRIAEAKEAINEMTKEKSSQTSSDASTGTSKIVKPPLLDTCHSYASDGPVVKARWPVFYSADKEA